VHKHIDEKTNEVVEKP
jgi:hypothetical protein